MNKPKLIILDVDNTLLHTWMQEALPPFIAPDDPYRIAEQREQYAKRLLAEYPGAQLWNGAIICPRPFLQEFIEYLADQPNLKIGIYSTAAPYYLAEILKQLPPILGTQSLFVWGKNNCIKMEKKRLKDLRLVANIYNIPIDQILMIDDLDVVIPAENRLPIKPFRVDLDLEAAINDDELQLAYLEILNRIIGEL